MLDSLKHIVPGTTTIPILNHVMIADGRAHANNCEMWGSEPFSLFNGQEPFCLPYNDLVGFLSRAGGAEISHETKGGHITLKAGRMRVTMPVLPAKDFPLMDPIKGERRFRFTRQAMAEVAPAISSEETRFYLCGAHVGNGHVEATDGHVAIRRPAETDDGEGMLLPMYFVRTLLRIAESDIELVTDGTRVSVSIGDTVLTSKLIDGTFPEISRFFPVGKSLSATIPGPEFFAAMDVVSMCDERTGRYVRIHINGDEAHFSSKGSEGRVFEWTCAAEGDAADISFQIGNIQKATGAHKKAGEIRMEFFGEAPGPVRFNGDLCMPVRA
jgi:DNA polymerase-3 subunit beta